METRQEIAQAIFKKLESLKPQLAESWDTPRHTHTRHFVVDDLLPTEVCQSISDNFPSDFANCIQRNSFRERKKTLAKVYKAGPLIDSAIYAFQEKRVIEAVESITGMTGLTPDIKLYAGGISMMSEGDFLNPHIDNSHNIDRSQYRRLNLLYYTSPGWDPAFGGNLELWDDSVREPLTIPSLFNRLVVMETCKTSWHSVSPVKANHIRQCVSNYYFSPQSPDRDDYYHVTSFLGRPEQPMRRLLGRADNSARNLAVKLTGRSRGGIQQNDQV